MNILIARAALSASLFAFSAAYGADTTQVFSAKLLGDNEVPPINSAGTATFRMEVDTSTTPPTIHFTLTFANLTGTATASHLHFAQFNVGGGVMIWLCGGGGQPACPAATSGTVAGTITSANVNGLPLQGIAAGDLTSALEAVGEGESYANLHTTSFGSGEIRGQVHRERRKESD
jgi:CHRD domain